jgi:tetratricopeptide (TPR) repeat protein
MCLHSHNRIALSFAGALLVAAPTLARAQATPPPTAEVAPANPASVTTAAAQPFIDAGLAAFRRRRFAQAETEFRKAVEADPSSAAAHYYLAYTKYKIVEPKRPFHPGKQEAAGEFARAYELDPTFQPVWQMKTTPGAARTRHHARRARRSRHHRAPAQPSPKE